MMRAMSPSRGCLWFAFVAASWVVLSMGDARAQGPRARVRQLTQEGMGAFDELDVERSQTLLEQALELAEREHVDGSELARVRLSLGVVAIGGRADSSAGLAQFMAALEADPTIAPDPMTSTPEIQSTFQLARARVASGAHATTPETARSVSTAPAIEHIPPTEQVVATPLPLYAVVRHAPSVTRTVVMYRAQGMRRYRQMAMQPVGAGVGIELPCDEILEGDFAYYLVGFDDSDRVVVSAASAVDPRHVRIVRVRTSGAAIPALPGRAPPARCGADECPPGLDCSAVPSSAVTDENEPSPTPAPRESRPRLFLQLGGVVGAYRTASGMHTDSAENVSSPPSVNAGYIPGGAPGCDADAGAFCVRVTQNGVLPVFGGRLTLGYWVSPRWAIAVGVRGGPGSGKSALSYTLLQFRAQVLVSNPDDTRFHAAITLGTSLGQTQVQPQQEGVAVTRPWAQVGLGSVQLGTILGYRFADHIGVFAQLDGNVFYRLFNVGADLTLGLEFDFGG